MRSIRPLVWLLFLLLTSGCAHTLVPIDFPESHAIPPTKARSEWGFLGAQPDDSSLSRFLVLNGGPEALRWRLALIDSATESLDVQTLIWRFDATGALLMERLLRATDRGVRVRLLLDDSFLSGEDPEFLEVQAHPNVEVRIFNPYQQRASSSGLRFLENANSFSRINHRMHNKVFAADNQAAIVGGRNIADEYFGFSGERNFRDFDLLATGPVVPELTAGFDTFWNSGWAYPVSIVDRKQAGAAELEKLRKQLPGLYAPLAGWVAGVPDLRSGWLDEWSRFNQAALPGRASVLQDDPSFTEGYASHHVAAGLRRVIASSDSAVRLATAYLVPTQALADALSAAVSRDVKVRILTNSLATNNHIPAHTAYRHRRKALVESDVGLHEYRRDAADREVYQAPGIDAEYVVLHAKVGVFDANRVLIGSLNLDPRSLVLNTELVVLVESELLAKAVQDALSPDFHPDNSWQVTIDEPGGRLVWRSSAGTRDRQPAGSFWRRVKDALTGLLPLDNEM